MAEDALSDLERSDPELLEQQAEQEQKQEEVAEPETPPAEEAAEAEPEAPPAEESPMIPKERFDEMASKLKTAEERADELLRMMLEAEQQKPQTPEVPPPEIDPDVEALVKPIVEAELKAELKQYDGVQDLIVERNRERAMQAAQEMLPETVDGSGISWKEVEEEWRQVPKEMQSQLDNVGGIAFLMQRIATRNAPAVKDENLAALSRRSHTGGESKAPMQAPKVTPQDVYNMTEEEFSKFTKGLTRGEGDQDPNYVDPLLR